MEHTLKAIYAWLDGTGVGYQVIDCDPDLADTAVFCARYGYALEDSANAILVRSKTGGERFVACVLLANTRLNVNRVVRKRMGARKVSFADPEETMRITGMELGGVTPFCLPGDLPLWVDSRVMERKVVILGGGNRASKIVVAPEVFTRTPNTEIVPDLAVEKT
jgi:prolyl-tRNA editing enzyme YbaK/EbsC (Cys-tRNA(Pro) deacylase)